MGNLAIRPELRTKLLNALDDALVESMKEHMKNFIIQKSSNPKSTVASRYVNGLKMIFDVYETAHEALEEFLENYK